MIVIVESGGANLLSLQAAFSRLNTRVQISSCQSEIKKASHVILPGVGSAEKVMQRLKSLDLIETIQDLTQPLLGICVGMQILFEYSEEGDTQGLGILEGRIEKLSSTNLILPHMGWSKFDIASPSKLLKDLPKEPYVYFVHSFAAASSALTLAESHYGKTFSAVVQKHNFRGVQFHPELSGTIGSQILKNFLECSA